jgi:hypothetical protein
MSRRPLVIFAHRSHPDRAAAFLAVERARAVAAETGVRSAFEAIRPSEGVHADGPPEVGTDG